MKSDIPWAAGSSKTSLRLDKTAFSLPTGVRAASFVIAPMVLVGLAAQQPALVFATLGALFLTNTRTALCSSLLGPSRSVLY